MREYTYFPGCSMDASAVPYAKSVQTVSHALEIELAELDDWNCCGSTPSDAILGLAALCIGMRNLALAEKTGRRDLVTACSSCFTSLNRVNQHLVRYPEERAKAETILGEQGLEYRGGIRVRHLLEVLTTDMGLGVLQSKVIEPLRSLKVAPYYGCQLVRPSTGFDDPENPQSLHDLIRVLGGEPISFSLAARCCGASLIISQPDFAIGLVNNILASAAQAGAECIITPCPLCQTNLDAFQGIINGRFKVSYQMPVILFTQLLGLALGLDPVALGTDGVMTSPKRVLQHVRKS